MSDSEEPRVIQPQHRPPLTSWLVVAAALIAFSGALTWNTMTGLDQMRRPKPSETREKITFEIDPRELDSEQAALDLIASEGPNRIEFGANGIGPLLLSAGWLQPEEWGVWSGEGVASISLPTTVAGETAASVRLDFVAFAPPGVTQTFTFSINGTELGRTTIAPVDESLIPAASVTLDIPEETAGEVRQDRLRLQIAISHPTRPVDAGVGPDTRRLGIGLSRITLNADEE